MHCGDTLIQTDTSSLLHMYTFRIVTCITCISNTDEWIIPACPFEACFTIVQHLTRKTLYT